ncbi:hypothetical protein K456DRAFT_1442797 [Colletotrichum gloeosporioides 23]|nr:hypothetical protein K456DRAFT_1442797 [Colletotrichum gloeosporioides 23]
MLRSQVSDGSARAPFLFLPPQNPILSPPLPHPPHRVRSGAPKHKVPASPAQPVLVRSQSWSPPTPQVSSDQQNRSSAVTVPLPVRPLSFRLGLVSGPHAPAPVPVSLNSHTHSRSHCTALLLLGTAAAAATSPWGPIHPSILSSPSCRAPSLPLSQSLFPLHPRRQNHHSLPPFRPVLSLTVDEAHPLNPLPRLRLPFHASPWPHALRDHSKTFPPDAHNTTS